ncbi:AT-rich interactive domain-containing 4-like [Micractinium conductrix]|uniref:AT-rich interactive domain-containing 4-like n=1 Tax=Micractinium conductrix TaxID=554055 RepID=A0A2P6V881_9CHLO|nr:AT-rich interactive domain-containing 4-like [Micractinium conductrix]|eukprot:PSC70291.1 AT-rich interactive domain-containing 4-like [Micractinium conductrix]
MASRIHRVLAILGGATPEDALGSEQAGSGPLGQLADAPGEALELHVVRDPKSLADVLAEVQRWRPTLLYVGGGVQAGGADGDLSTQVLQPPTFLPAGNADAADRFVAALKKQPLEAVFFDFPGSAALAERLLASRNGGGAAAAAAAAAAADEGSSKSSGAAQAIAWQGDGAAPVLPAWAFAHAFFGLLRVSGVTVSEAYAIASRAARMHGPAAPASPVSNDGTPPPAPSEPLPLPALLPTGPPPELPACASIAPLALEGVDLSAGVAAAFPGWRDVRLLAPNAELRLLLAGVSQVVNTESLRLFGEALRGLLAAEVRCLQVAAVTPLERPPPHLAQGAGAARCQVTTASSALCMVTLGGPTDLLENKELVCHALRQAMTADAHTLQLRAPPPGVAPPPVHASPAVASGAPVVEVLAAASVWCVQLLKELAASASYRGLVQLGVAAVSTTPVAAFGPADALRFTHVATNGQPDKAQPTARKEPTPEEAAAPAAAVGAGSGADEEAAAAPAVVQQLVQLMNGSSSDALAAAAAAVAAGGSPGVSLPASGATGSVAAAGRSATPEPAPAVAQQLLQQQQLIMRQQAASGGPLPWKSARPLLAACSEEHFLSDLIAFLTDRQGRQIDPRTFPEAILNGSKLDLFHLYKEVTSRGGYSVGNGINWKGQVFPRMRNYTANHKMTGVGNALKRHYQVFLQEYEQAHPEDLTGDRCALCGRGDDAGGDWVSCDACDSWVHFSCDVRHTRGSFKDYAKGRGRAYHCPSCSEVKRHRIQQTDAQQQQQAAVLQAALLQVAGNQAEMAAGAPAPVEL